VRLHALSKIGQSVRIITKYEVREDVHMKKFFVPVFGEENLITVKTGHGNVPQVALKLDENKDNKSDLIEWMLS
jgi:hypothetical protein